MARWTDESEGIRVWLAFVMMAIALLGIIFLAAYNRYLDSQDKQKCIVYNNTPLSERSVLKECASGR